MDHRPIPWAKLAAMTVVAGFLCQALVWCAGEINGRQEKLARNDSAYAWSMQALSLAKRNYWSHVRDSVRIDELYQKRKH